jgi:hypothetical protein
MFASESPRDDEAVDVGALHDSLNCRVGSTTAVPVDASLLPGPVLSERVGGFHLRTVVVLERSSSLLRTGL